MLKKFRLPQTLSLPAYLQTNGQAPKRASPKVQTIRSRCFERGGPSQPALLISNLLRACSCLEVSLRIFRLGPFAILLSLMMWDSGSEWRCPLRMLEGGSERSDSSLQSERFEGQWRCFVGPLRFKGGVGILHEPLLPEGSACHFALIWQHIAILRQTRTRYFH